MSAETTSQQPTNDGPHNGATTTAGAKEESNGDKTKASGDDVKQNKQEEHDHKPKAKGPAGGFDATPVPHAPPGYTVRITFHRADKLPMADLSTLSSDPYLMAELRTSLSTRHKEDPVLRFRSHTIWRSTTPAWEEDWIIAHMPATGFKLKLRIYDEDPNGSDDRLGNVHVHVPRIDDRWEGMREQEFPIGVRSGNKPAYLLRAMAVATRHVKHMSGSMFLSVQVLGKSPGEDGGRAYTVGKNYWCKHYSPLLGRITGTKTGLEETDYGLPDQNGQAEAAVAAPKTLGPGRALDASEERRVGAQETTNPELAENNLANGVLDKALHKEQQRQRKRASRKQKDYDRGGQRYNFEANQMQLAGPVPAELYHRYVEFRPFIKSLYTKTGIRGNILNRALHHQHMQVYNFNRDTRYGVFDEPCRDMTLKFLELCHFDAGARIFTYVITLDGLLRFTETGKEFGIDMLSKHTMHSDREIYIAFSGEFFIRRLRHRHRPSGESNKSGPLDELAAGGQQPSPPPKSPPLPLDPCHYELVIDNDSGTYRPSAKQLPKLRAFLRRNLPGLKISTLDCQGDEELMGRLKGQQRERKKKEQGGNRIVYTQLNASDSSISSSDEERLDRLVESDAHVEHTHKLGEAVAPLVGNHPHVREKMGEHPAPAPATAAA